MVPKTEPTPVPMAKLREIHQTKKKSERQGRKVAGEKRPPVFKMPPKGQYKGPIRPGPAGIVPCPICTRLFSTKDEPVVIGVRTRHAAKHLADHRMGRIKRPVEPER